MDRQGGDVPGVELNAAAVCLDEADDHVEAGGLAGTVRPEQAHDLTTFQAERHIPDNLAPLVGFCYVGDFEAVHQLVCGLSEPLQAWPEVAPVSMVWRICAHSRLVPGWVKLAVPMNSTTDSTPAK